MTIVRLGYVAMSVHLQNCSPSQTMTYRQFSQLEDREAAIARLERIAQSNLENCLRLLKHNAAHDIKFFRLSSRLVPLATHPELRDWKYLKAIQEKLAQIGSYIAKHQQRVDFHPDHFVLLNSPREEVFVESLHHLKHHYYLLKGMNIDHVHRCVMHVGGTYKDVEAALERFIAKWANVPRPLQRMIMLENDDKSFDLLHTLYLCEKLDIPLVFDYHHHLAHHQQKNWEREWLRVVQTWRNSPLPIKMHISSPKSEKQFRSHADDVDVTMFMDFLQGIKGSVDQIDCMIEAKLKDQALFNLRDKIKQRSEFEMLDQASFKIK